MESQRGRGGAISVEWADLSAAVGGKAVLRGLSGAARSGECVVVIGPSGSGKSTLLSALSCRFSKKVRITRGGATYDGVRWRKELKRSVGLVEQDDCLFARLTVRETLEFAAKLRGVADAERRAADLIDALGLAPCAGQMIGGFNSARGISGGQRRRVSIGAELVLAPRLLLCDEPTSGLDSRAALRIFLLLRQSLDCTVVCTLHQPSDAMYDQFDALAVLVRGESAYFGPDAVAHFRAQGYEPRDHVPAADFVLDAACALFDEDQGSSSKASSDEEEDLTGLFSIKKAQQQQQQQQKTIATAVAEGAAASPSSVVVVVSTTQDQHHVKGGDDDGENGASKPLKKKTTKGVDDDADSSSDANLDDPTGFVRWVDQVPILTRRSWKAHSSELLDELYLINIFSISLLVAVLWVHRASQRPRTESSVQDVSGLLFFMPVYWGFQWMIKALFSFGADVAVVRKERAARLYRVSAYFVAHTAYDTACSTLVAPVLSIPYYFAVGLRPSPRAFLGHLLVQGLNGLAAQSAGLALGAWFLNGQRAATAQTIYMLSTMLTGGFYLKYIPVWLAWIKYLSITSYAYIAFMKLEYYGAMYDCDEVGQKRCPVKDIETLEKLGIGDRSIHREVLVLLAFIVAWRLLGYAGLRKNTA